MLTRRGFIKLAAVAVAATQAPALATAAAPETLRIRIIEVAPIGDAQQWMLVCDDGPQRFVKHVTIPSKFYGSHAEEAASRIAKAAREIKRDIYYYRDPELWASAIPHSPQDANSDAGLRYRLSSSFLDDIEFV